MKACRRLPAPDFLAEHGEAWSQEYARMRQENPAYTFQWKQHRGQRVNHAILPPLRNMTQSHCMYCDGFPIRDTAYDTIDHFLPKSRYPHLVYIWENLYLACPRCQRDKEANFDTHIDPQTYQDELLRPDAPDYRFERYFLCNYKEGTIEVNPQASETDRMRAAYAIRNLGLNNDEVVESRKRQLRQFSRLSPSEQEQEIDDFPYRYFLMDEARSGQ